MLSSWARDLVLAALSAVLLVLSFPPFDLSVLAWVGLVPLLVALEGKGLKDGFLLSYVTGLLFFTGIFYWIWTVDAYNLIDHGLLGVAYLFQYVGLWGLGLTWIRKWTGLSAALVAPPLWVALEYTRSHLSFLSLPWMLFGHSQYLHPSLIQITSLTGVYGLSFLIVLTNAAIAEAICCIRQRLAEFKTSPRFSFPTSPLISLTVAGLFMVAYALYGSFILSRAIEGERMTIALVQGNVSQDHKWNVSYRQTILERYSELTRKAAQGTPALIIWPETAVPGDVQHAPDLQRRLGRLAIEAQTYLLVGSAESGKSTNRQLPGKYYNSMVLFSPDGKIEGQYRKLVLVPFGEYEPLKGIVKWPKAIVSAMDDTLPGQDHTLFTLGSATFAATICWETIFADLFREFVKRGARFMVNATDESWFGQTAAHDQLLAMTTFRAAENRVAIARSANMGISAFIDPFGRITHRLKGRDPKELLVEGILIGEVLLSEEKTIYTRYGDIFAFLQIAASALILLHTCMKAGVPMRADPKAQRIESTKADEVRHADEASSYS